MFSLWAWQKEPKCRAPDLWIIGQGAGRLLAQARASITSASFVMSMCLWTIKLDCCGGGGGWEKERETHTCTERKREAERKTEGQICYRNTTPPGREQPVYLWKSWCAFAQGLDEVFTAPTFAGLFGYERCSIRRTGMRTSIALLTQMLRKTLLE